MNNLPSEKLLIAIFKNAISNYGVLNAVASQVKTANIILQSYNQHVKKIIRNFGKILRFPNV